ncbi:unnamed protein product [Scytosiphon promiscuus]
MTSLCPASGDLPLAFHRTISLSRSHTPVWNRRKQQWMEVESAPETPGKEGGAGGATSPTSNLLSSNAYASGVNQNAGNFLTEKPITRIHAPPGGVSSISFGDEHTAPAAAAGTASKQQGGLVLGTPTQPATPESAESVEDGPAPIPMMDLPPAPSAVEEEEEEEEEEVAAAATAAVPPPAPAAAQISSNAYATGSNQNSGNFMTGRPTTRVRAPPGGNNLPPRACSAGVEFGAGVGRARERKRIGVRGKCFLGAIGGPPVSCETSPVLFERRGVSSCRTNSP